MYFDVSGNFKNQSLENEFTTHDLTDSKVYFTVFPLLVTLANLSFAFVDYMRLYVYDKWSCFFTLVSLRSLAFIVCVISLFFLNQRGDLKKYISLQPVIRIIIAIMFILAAISAPGSKTLLLSVFGVTIAFYAMHVKYIQEVLVTSLILAAAPIINVILTEGGIQEFSSVILLLVTSNILLIWLLRSKKISDRKIFLFQKELNTKIQDQRRLFSLFTHDISNPLLTLLASSSILQKKLTKPNYEEIVKYAGKIDHQLNHLSNLVKNLRMWQETNLSNLDKSNDSNKFHFSQILSPTLGLVLPMAENKNIALKHSDLDFEITGDSYSIETCFRNLVTNAVKFTPSGGEIDIDLFLNGDEKVIQITNTGSQLSKEIIEGIEGDHNENFSSIKGTGGESGSGYGLRACKELLYLSDARLVAKNINNDKVCFQIWLAQ